MKVLTSFLVILLFPFSAFAASVDLSYIIVFGAHGYTTYDYKTDLDCKAELGFNVDSQFINSELEKALNLRTSSKEPLAYISIASSPNAHSCL